MSSGIVCVGLIVMWCTNPSAPVSDYCSVYKPITIPRAAIMSLPKQDRVKILRPILRENMKWKRLCAKGSKRRNWNVRR